MSTSTYRFVASHRFVASVFVAGAVLGSGGSVHAQSCTPPSFSSSSSNGVGTRPSGVAIADLNRDGRSDAITVNESSDSITVLLVGSSWPRKTVSH